LWVCGNPSTFRTHSAILSIEFLFFEEKTKNKTKKKNGRLLSGGPVKRLPASPQLPVFLGYYVI
jgi:hypothetical protein